MFPAQALAETLSKKGWEVAMITDARGLVHAGNIPADPIREVSAATINPRKPIAAIKGMIKLANGMNEAKSFMRGWKPDVVAGFGGYPAFPAVKAAQGNPLRAQILSAIPETYAAPRKDIHITIVGGSLGAKLISETVPAAIALLPQDMQKRLVVVQQTRAEFLDEARELYKLTGVRAICETFFSDIENWHERYRRSHAQPRLYGTRLRCARKPER